MDLTLLDEEITKHYRSVIYDETKGAIRAANDVFIDISWITDFKIYDDRVEIAMRNGNKAIFYISGAYQLLRSDTNTDNTEKD